MKIDWDEDDTILSKKAAKHVKQELEQLQDKQIILMTHIVTHSKFVVPTLIVFLIFQCIYRYIRFRPIISTVSD